jgi:hypothetical protein
LRGGRRRGGRGWGQGGEMNQALYAHMNNKRKMKKKKFVNYLKQNHFSHSLCELKITFGSHFLSS